jgi:hypothetical protein
VRQLVLAQVVLESLHGLRQLLGQLVHLAEEARGHQPADEPDQGDEDHDDERQRPAVTQAGASTDPVGQAAQKDGEDNARKREQKDIGGVPQQGHQQRGHDADADQHQREAHERHLGYLPGAFLS